ncbi:MAG TPA: ATP synthase F1 subunit delta [Blastocatellia bacterium]
MSAVAVARRYAEALADVALANKQADVVGQELGELAELFKPGSELNALFANPIISQADKRKVLDIIVERTHPTRTTVNLLKLLLQHYRLHNLSVLEEQYRRELNEREGIVRADVTTAGPIGAGEQEKLKQQLQILTGKSIQLEFKTDPALIGGAVTRIGSVIYDGSIRTQLDTIKSRLKAGED